MTSDSKVTIMNWFSSSDYQPTPDPALPSDFIKDGVLDIYSVATRQALVKILELRNGSRTEPTVEINQVIQSLLKGSGKSELSKELWLEHCKIHGTSPENVLVIDSLAAHAEAYPFACTYPDMEILNDPIDEWTDLEAQERERVENLVSKPYSKNAKKNPLAFLKDKANKKAELVRKNPFFKNTGVK